MLNEVKNGVFFVHYIQILPLYRCISGRNYLDCATARQVLCLVLCPDSKLSSAAFRYDLVVPARRGNVLTRYRRVGGTLEGRRNRFLEGFLEYHFKLADSYWIVF